MGAIQPIRIFLLPPSRKSTQMWGFYILKLFSILSMQWISFLPLLFLPPSFASVHGQVVCQHEMGGVPLIS